MAEITQYPAICAVRHMSGESFTIHMDFSIDLTGYTFTGAVYAESEIAIPITVIDLATGKIDMTITKTLVSDVPRNTEYSWACFWIVGGIPRIATGGPYEIRTIKNFK